MRLEKWIITGMAVCLAALSAGAPGRDELSLPLALFEDGDWAGVRRECRRVLARNPTDYDALLLDSMAAIQAGDSSSNVTHALLKVFTQATNAPLRTTAAYELGRAYWRQDRPDEAYTYIKYAFQHAEDHAMLLHSACSLELLREEYGSRLPDDREIQMQLHTLRGLLWPKALREECRITRGPPRLSVLSLPGAWVTRFYRTQIRPAIGDRCELHPSCSEYFRQACGKHGLLGFTMYADRGVREPDVVKYAEDPVMIDGTIKYADPLEAHDWWMHE